MRARIIANKHSGSIHAHNHQHQLEQVMNKLRQHGWEIELWETDGPGSGRRLAAQAIDEGVEAVISAGGDGTLNEVIQTLAGSNVALGVLPMGTMNVWAREVGIPLDPLEAANVLIEGVHRRIDLGMANERYFLLMAGIGIDAKITSVVEQHSLKRWGVFSYLLTGTLVGLGPLDFRLRLRMDGRRFRTRAHLIIIGNTRLYGGLMTFTYRACCDDGQLDVCIIRRQPLWGRALVLLNAIRKRHPLGPRVSYERFQSLAIDASSPVPIQVDGEPIGTLPVVFRVAPQMLTVIVPRSTPEGLFCRAESDVFHSAPERHSGKK